MTARLTTIIAVVAGLSVFGPLAGAVDLEELLSRQAEAVYTGEQTVVCNTPDGRTSDVFEVSQAEGVVVSRDAGGVVRAAMVAVDAGWIESGRYDVRDGRSGRFLQRPVEIVEVLEAETIRLRMRFDVTTGVLLASDVFNADGTTYCSTRFVSFEPGQPGLTADVDLAEVVMESVDSFNERALPSVVGGFDRLSVSEGPEPEIAAAYYGDGVFSFTVLNSEKQIEVPELAQVPDSTIEGNRYQRAFSLGSAAIAWTSPEGGFVLVGELPLDLQGRVLADLPRPEEGFFRKLWRGLFD